MHSWFGAEARHEDQAGGRQLVLQCLLAFLTFAPYYVTLTVYPELIRAKGGNGAWLGVTSW